MEMMMQLTIARSMSIVFYIMLTTFNTSLMNVNGFLPSTTSTQMYTSSWNYVVNHRQQHFPKMTELISDATIAIESIKIQPQYSKITNVRRKFFLEPIVSLATLASLLPSQSVQAASTATDSQVDTIWITGKAPIKPGQKPRDKNDVTGTKRDPNFLRSIADCKNQCENNSMSSNSNKNGGYAKGKEECLSECQDICCTTYEQCTFAIVPRI